MNELFPYNSLLNSKAIMQFSDAGLFTKMKLDAGQGVSCFVYHESVETPFGEIPLFYLSEQAIKAYFDIKGGLSQEEAEEALEIALNWDPQFQYAHPIDDEVLNAIKVSEYNQEGSLDFGDVPANAIMAKAF